VGADAEIKWGKVIPRSGEIDYDAISLAQRHFSQVALGAGVVSKTPTSGPNLSYQSNSPMMWR